MSHRLSLSRAAHLVGVHRSTLQKMIGEGRLATAEGMVEVDELRRAFPLAELEASGSIEWVNRIKEESFGRRVRERMLPSQEVLAQRLFAQGLELAGASPHRAALPRARRRARADAGASPSRAIPSSPARSPRWPTGSGARSRATPPMTSPPSTTRCTS